MLALAQPLVLGNSLAGGTILNICHSLRPRMGSVTLWDFLLRSGPTVGRTGRGRQEEERFSIGPARAQTRMAYGTSLFAHAFCLIELASDLRPLPHRYVARPCDDGRAGEVLRAAPGAEVRPSHAIDLYQGKVVFCVIRQGQAEPLRLREEGSCPVPRDWLHCSVCCGGVDAAGPSSPGLRGSVSLGRVRDTNDICAGAQRPRLDVVGARSWRRVRGALVVAVWPASARPAIAPCATTLAALMDDEKFATALAAFRAAGLESVLSEARPVTVFAPGRAGSSAKIPAGELRRGLADH